MLWICDKCGAKWAYPVEKCIYCRGAVKAEHEKNLKVIGRTDVFAASAEHEKVPYACLLLEDEKGNLHIRKTFSDVKIGGALRSDEGAPKKNLVAVSRTGYSAKDAAKRAMQILNLKEIRPGMKILIKPNLALAKPASSGIVTNPEVVRGVIEFLLERGIEKNNIIVAESSVIGFSTQEAYEKSGMRALCEELGIEFKDLTNGKFVNKAVEISGKKYVFGIAEDAFENDLVINVPVIKTHFQTEMSLALKNMKGLVDTETRKRMHKINIDEQIAYMQLALPKYLTIADGSIALEGMGPAVMGKPANLSLVIAGRDAVALEAAVSEIIGIPISKHTMLAAKLGFGISDANEIEIIGEELEVIKRKFEPASGRLSPHADVDLADGKPCSGCLNSVWGVLNKLKSTRGKRICVAFGSMLSRELIDGSAIAIGDCACGKIAGNGKTAKLLGCPPDMAKQEEIIRKYLLEQ
ncbi:MAG: DUF362 domain-containing protein [Candidatus Diapherotrites archaeon]|nr:DUF362 domain-containing protein [Candidatus Diapherotrites archaeon]